MLLPYRSAASEHMCPPCFQARLLLCVQPPEHSLVCVMEGGLKPLLMPLSLIPKEFCSLPPATCISVLCLICGFVWGTRVA